MQPLVESKEQKVRYKNSRKIKPGL